MLTVPPPKPWHSQHARCEFMFSVSSTVPDDAVQQSDRCLAARAGRGTDTSLGKHVRRTVSDVTTGFPGGCSSAVTNAPGRPHQ